MLKQVLEVYELLDNAFADGQKVAELLKSRGLKNINLKPVKGEKGSTDFIKIVVHGSEGKGKKGDAPTIGIIGRLGGIGARPERIGMVSDAEGAVTAISCALKLADMKKSGDVLKGDLIIATHICPDSASIPHEPVPFMGSPVDMAEMNKHEVDPAMDAILSIDTTRGNKIINHKGFAITPTVKEGYILKVSDDLLELMEWTTGSPPKVCPVTMQDITPYGNGLYHLNSIMQPCTVTDSPVVGIAITTETAVPGCATGANHELDVENAARYCIEVAKAFTEGRCKFYDEEEFNKIVKLYGRMNILQTLPDK